MESDLEVVFMNDINYSTPSLRKSLSKLGHFLWRALYRDKYYTLNPKSLLYWEADHVKRQLNTTYTCFVFDVLSARSKNVFVAFTVGRLDVSVLLPIGLGAI